MSLNLVDALRLRVPLSKQERKGICKSSQASRWMGWVGGGGGVVEKMIYLHDTLFLCQHIVHGMSRPCPQNFLGIEKKFRMSERFSKYFLKIAYFYYPLVIEVNKSTKHHTDKAAPRKAHK